MGAALLLLGVSDVAKARRRGISRSDVITAVIFAATGIYFGLQLQSQELGGSSEWSAIASLFFLVAAIMTVGIPLASAWSGGKSRSV